MLIAVIKNLQVSKAVFTASLLDTQHKRSNVEEKPTSSLVMLLSKELNGVAPSSYGRDVVGSSSLPLSGKQSLSLFA